MNRRLATRPCGGFQPRHNIKSVRSHVSRYSAMSWSCYDWRRASVYPLFLAFWSVGGKLTSLKIVHERVNISCCVYTRISTGSEDAL